MNSSQQNNPEKKNTQKEFFRLTGQQISVNIHKYEKVLNKPQVTIFNKKQLDEIEQEKQEKLLFKRLNSTDAAMLEESAYKVIDNPELKLENRISKYEKALDEVSEKLIVAQTVQDLKAQKELAYKKAVLEKNLEFLKKQYSEHSFETGFAHFITKALLLPQNLKTNLIKYFKSILLHTKILKHFKPLARAMAVRETIGKLNKINKSVDELVKMKVPFGEQEEKYETLVNHLQRAGALHSQILKELKKS